MTGTDALSPPLGLRDRKRLETRARLEEAATVLALRNGLEQATIDAICERAGVSSRTFFNYFATKEDAVLGIRDTFLDEETIRSYAAQCEGNDAVETVLGLLFAAFGPSIILQPDRIELVRRHPELFGRQLEQMMRGRQQLSTAVQTLLSPAGANPVDAAVAETLLSFCMAALQVAVREWVDADSRMDTADATLALKQRTATLLKTASGLIR